MTTDDEVQNTGAGWLARADGRALDEMRPVSFQRDFTVMALSLIHI